MLVMLYMWEEKLTNEQNVSLILNELAELYSTEQIPSVYICKVFTYISLCLRNALVKSVCVCGLCVLILCVCACLCV